MSNTCGNKYALTALFPIKSGAHHYSELKEFLRAMSRHEYGSPFSQVFCVHMARFFIVQDFFYEGLPAKRDHLQSRYLAFVCDFDGESLKVLVNAMRTAMPSIVDEVWQHCVAYPGNRHTDALLAYFEKCQIHTTLFFVDRPDDDVDTILHALISKRRFAQFIEDNQTKIGNDLKDRFYSMWRELEMQPCPAPGSM
jgi:hypothetical protein